MKNQNQLRSLSLAILALLGGAPVAGAQSPGPIAGPVPAKINGVGVQVMPDYDLPNYSYSPAPIVHADGTITGGLRKFVDQLPGLTSAAANTHGQYLPLATPMGASTPAGVPLDGDYYEIALIDYREQMHSDLPGPTKLRGYVQIYPPGTGDLLGTPLLDLNGIQVSHNGRLVWAYDKPHYLGPVILAAKDRPVRVKFYNLLPSGAGGNLFIPVDESIMGAGKFDVDWSLTDPEHPLLNPAQHITGVFTQNRATLHLHGGNTPWISDGTPHQWTVPFGDPTPYKKGVSSRDVPDMPPTGDGEMTFYWSNQQGGRLMFYHDHALGLTRVNVYAGEAAGYLLIDKQVEDALASVNVPGTVGKLVGGTSLDLGHLLPLVIQDKTFIHGQPSGSLTGNHVTPGTGTYATDPLWSAAVDGSQPGDLWFPHVVMPNQNPWDTMTGANPHGRWDYGPWFWPPQPGNIQQMPLTTIIPEAFMDTPIVNGTAYPYVNVDPTKYRLQILNACNDRMLNLQFYQADGRVSRIELKNSGSGYVAGSVSVSITDNAGVGSGALAHAVVAPDGTISGIVIDKAGSGYLSPMVTITDTSATPIGAGASADAVANTEVAMVPATPPDPAFPPTPWTFPDSWKVQTRGMIPDILDNRPGGVPNPDFRGPAFIQIGSEGGLLPAPVVTKNCPVGYEQNKRNIVVLNVAEKTLFMGPAERADVIVDFTKFAGKTVILYSDAPAPVPAGDPRNDMYTGAGDMSASAGPAFDQGGPATPLAGFGPNTRTIMQFRVSGTPATGPVAVDDYDAGLVTALQTVLPTQFAATQPRNIVPPGVYGLIQDTKLTFTPQVDVSIAGSVTPAGTPVTMLMQPKAIQELFDPYGRMNSILGTEVPFTTIMTQTTIPLEYIDPTTETIPAGDTQIWKITHNGVDTHAIHFHLVNVQVINRVGWDGAVRPPDANELGWKETVRMHPLEDIIVLATAAPQILPFSLPNSKRPLDVTGPIGTTPQFSNLDPTTGNQFVPAVANVVTDFGWEYVWHCHLLGHEENDMMRPLVMTNPTGYNTADHQAPSLTYGISPSPNAAGWNNANVSVTLTAADQLGASGLAYQVAGLGSISYSSPGAQVIPATTVRTPTTGTAAATVNLPLITTEGTTAITGTAVDGALTPNTATTLFSVKVDKTAPSITGAASTTLWTRNPVTVDFSATDALSGIASVTPQVVVTTQGANQSVIGTATDNAGNTATATVGNINIDTTAPTITGAASTTAWTRNPVTVTFSATDALSGVASVTAPVIVSTQGANQSVTGTATDNAGNTATATVGGINIDTALPTLSAVTVPAANAAGWNNANVTGIRLTGTDNLSGLSAFTYSVTVVGRNGSTAGNYNGAIAAHPLTYTSPTAIALPGNGGNGLTVNGTYTVNINYTLTDVAGNTTTGVLPLIVKIDKNPPSVGPFSRNWGSTGTGQNRLFNSLTVGAITSTDSPANGASGFATTPATGTLTVTSGNFTTTVVITSGVAPASIPLPNLRVGASWTIRATFTDVAGNPGAQSYAGQF